MTQIRWSSGLVKAFTLDSNRPPGYRPKFALSVLVFAVLVVLLAGFAMLSTLPRTESGTGFTGLQQTEHPSHYLSGSGFRDLLEKAL